MWYKSDIPHLLGGYAPCISSATMVTYPSVTPQSNHGSRGYMGAYPPCNVYNGVHGVGCVYTDLFGSFFAASLLLLAAVDLETGRGFDRALPPRVGDWATC